MRLANWMQLLKPAAYDLYEHKVLDHAQVVVLSLLGGQNYWQYGFERLQAWAQGTTDGKPRTLIIVPGDDARRSRTVCRFYSAGRGVSTAHGATCVRVGSITANSCCGLSLPNT